MYTKVHFGNLFEGPCRRPHPDFHAVNRWIWGTKTPSWKIRTDLVATTPHIWYIGGYSPRNWQCFQPNQLSDYITNIHMIYIYIYPIYPIKSHFLVKTLFSFVMAYSQNSHCINNCITFFWLIPVLCSLGLVRISLCFHQAAHHLHPTMFWRYPQGRGALGVIRPGRQWLMVRACPKNGVPPKSL